MGIRKIEDEIDLKEAMKKRATELRIKEIKAKASTENFTKERLVELAKNHGVILALTPELKKEVNELQQRYNIPTSKIITEQIQEQDVLDKKSKIDHDKLGMLAYQRVLMRKDETGGILPISEVFEIVNTGTLKNKVELKDLIKSMKNLSKKNVIDKMMELDSGATIIHFFPIQYTSDQVRIMELAKDNGYITLEEACTKLEWSQDRALRALDSLERSGVAKFSESILKGKQWSFPSI
ncbi:MAG: hypothetical protein JW891_03140 [Candidatus Lokiarchaeota archaeon]|nr:hypothetical protein [Candidatus Lokiarchaeota archaeon]